MASWDHEDLKSQSHPMQPVFPPEVVLVDREGRPLQYHPTLPPVTHDPGNMRDQVDLKGRYPKLADLQAVEAAVWGAEFRDPVERTLRQALLQLRASCTDELEKLQRMMMDQHNAQARFNAAYADIEAILEKYPELLKP